MLRATFFSVFQERAILYTRDNDRINITISVVNTHMNLRKILFTQMHLSLKSANAIFFIPFILCVRGICYIMAEK